MDNNPPTPQQPQTPPQPQTQQPAQPANQPPLMPNAPAPQQPIDAKKAATFGWILVAVSIVTTLVGLYFGYALVASALIAALGGRIGLQTKNKPLAIVALIIAGLNLLLFGLAVFLGS